MEIFIRLPPIFPTAAVGIFSHCGGASSCGKDHNRGDQDNSGSNDILIYDGEYTSSLEGQIFSNLSNFTASAPIHAQRIANLLLVILLIALLLALSYLCVRRLCRRPATIYSGATIGND